MKLMSHSANFKRVVCPAELTSRSGCSRNDDKILAGGAVSSGRRLHAASSTAAAFAAMMLGVLSI
jgi:hypothetical protein